LKKRRPHYEIMNVRRERERERNKKTLKMDMNEMEEKF
jgi:hypothetical protein